MLLNCGVGEDSWQSLGLPGDQPVHPKGNQSWIFIGRTVAEAEAPILWPPDGKNWLTGKDPDAGKDWRQVEKGRTEDEMAGWHHWLNGRQFEWTPGVGDGQGALACCGSWGHKESDTTEQLNCTELNPTVKLAYVFIYLIYVSFPLTTYTEMNTVCGQVFWRVHLYSTLGMMSAHRIGLINNHEINEHISRNKKHWSENLFPKGHSTS